MENIVECTLEELTNAFEKVQKLDKNSESMDRSFPIQTYISKGEGKQHHIASNKLEFILENGNIILTSPVKLYIKEI
jgi:hypothetical protein